MAIADTDEVRKLLSMASDAHADDWWVNCRDYWTRKYLDTFSAAFPKETQSESEQRKKIQPHAKTLTRLPAETESERMHRIHRASEVRILCSANTACTDQFSAHRQPPQGPQSETHASHQVDEGALSMSLRI